MGAQPKRSPAQAQAEAIADVERIARALHAETRNFDWEAIPERARERWRGYVRALLHRDVIRVGSRPEAPETPIAGQTTIDDMPGDDR